MPGTHGKPFVYCGDCAKLVDFISHELSTKFDKVVKPRKRTRKPSKPKEPKPLSPMAALLKDEGVT